MVHSNAVFADNEFSIMTEISENQTITQRELSRKLGLSLGSVNVLINKMAKEGLIKMEQTSQRQVFYMLTPVGAMEKARKTVQYLKVHYRAIYETKEKIKMVLNELGEKHDVIYILTHDNEMNEIIEVAINEQQVHNSNVNIKIIGKVQELDVKEFNAPVLLHMMVEPDLLNMDLKPDNLAIINLLERI